MRSVRHTPRVRTSAAENRYEAMRYNHCGNSGLKPPALSLGLWPGPYGNWGSRKYLLASMDQSLAHMGLDYVDIFYSHRVDPETPLEETMMALDSLAFSDHVLAVDGGINLWAESSNRG